jgi:hypothetical protein
MVVVHFHRRRQIVPFVIVTHVGTDICTSCTVPFLHQSKNAIRYLICMIVHVGSDDDRHLTNGTTWLDEGDSLPAALQARVRASTSRHQLCNMHRRSRVL